MTSNLEWKPDNPDDEPQAKIVTNNGEYLLNRENSALFTFMGRLALYDHIYYCDTEEPDINSFFIFSFTQGFKKLSKYMMDNSFSAHLNMIEVGSGDVDAYIRSSLADIKATNYIPDSWLKDKDL